MNINLLDSSVPAGPVDRHACMSPYPRTCGPDFTLKLNDRDQLIRRYLKDDVLVRVEVEFYILRFDLDIT